MAQVLSERGQSCQERKREKGVPAMAEVSRPKETRTVKVRMLW